MKNSEEDILKRFLQDTFSDYEPEPSDLTWEYIRKEIQPQQPSVGARLRQWIMPVMALLLIISGITWNKDNSENKTELALNSMKETLNNQEQVIDYQINKTIKTTGFVANNVERKSEKTSVNKATSKVESKALSEVKRPFKVPTFSTISTEPIAKQDLQEYAVSTKEFVEIDDKPKTLSNDTILDNISKTYTVRRDNVVREDNAGRVLNPASVRNEISPVVVSVFANNDLHKVVSLSDPVNTDNNGGNTDNNMEGKSLKSINLHGATFRNPNSDMNEAVIQEIRYIKTLEMLKNKDFVLSKHELTLPQISKININREAKPIRRPLYVSMSFTPLQTYRILTVNRMDIQNLQTNKLFDAERNGFSLDLGFTKSVGNKWNLRGNIAYLKMRQWAEYQVNTDIISVKNSNYYSNNSAVGSNDNEFIGQTRIEAKTLHMVGLKADVQRFFKITGRNRYFISGGSQLMYESTQRQSNVFINASAGFQHLVNKDCFLTIEPTASYLLNNINDSKSLIQTNAYNLGLKLGVNFRVK